jgi:hypothetical protein
MGSLNSEQQNKLRGEERNWIKWRDGEAERIARQSSAGGSAYGVDHTNALLKLTLLRIELLQQYLSRGQQIPSKGNALQKPGDSKDNSPKGGVDKFREDKQKFDKF